MNEKSPKRLDRLAPDRRSLLENRHVVLRDVFPADYGALYEIVLSDGVMDTWQAGTQTLSFERFCASLWENVLISLAFRSADSAEILGLVRIELANFRHQTAQLAIYSSQKAQGTALPMMAAATMIDFAMRRYSFRKLYAEVPEYNFAALRSGVGTFFEIEGHLVEHEIVNNDLWDTFVIAISRDRWSTVIRPLVASWRTK